MKNLAPSMWANLPEFPSNISRAFRKDLIRSVAGLLAAGAGLLVASTIVQNPVGLAAVSLPVLRARGGTDYAVAGSSDRIQRDIFLSNFAQARTPDFGVEGIAIEDRVEFARSFAQTNSPDQIQAEWGTGNSYLSREWVAQTSAKYFGDAPVESGRYYLDQTEGEAPPRRFARVESWEAVLGSGSDRLRGGATVRVYEAPVDWKENPYTWATPTNSVPGTPRFIGRWRAILRGVPGKNGAPFRYVLLSWEHI